MYQLLLVEDEKSIAQGIANGVPWSDWGFAIAGICGNGAEAVDFLRDQLLLRGLSYASCLL
jgi:two-component system response regulator YesN